MERLSIEYAGQFMPKEMCSIDRFGGADDCFTCGELCEKYIEKGCTECPVQKVFERLAEYEDSGLTPDQIKELDKQYTEKCGQIKEIVKRLEKEAEAARAGGNPEISGAYQIAIWTIKDITGIGGLSDEQRDLISWEKD